jgi:hypothetical protein
VSTRDKEYLARRMTIEDRAERARDTDTSHALSSCFDLFFRASPFKRTGTVRPQICIDRQLHRHSSILIVITTARHIYDMHPNFPKEFRKPYPSKRPRYVDKSITDMHMLKLQRRNPFISNAFYSSSVVGKRNSHERGMISRPSHRCHNLQNSVMRMMKLMNGLATFSW